MAIPILGKRDVRVQDLAGQRFGKLIVLEYAGKFPGNGNAMWRCKCDCGNETVAVAGRMKNGSVASCGCRRSEAKQNTGADLTGQKFGRLAALERGPYRKSGASHSATWRCRCDCGNVLPAVEARSLTDGRSESCGCIRKQHNNRKPHGDSKRPGYSTWAGMVQRCTNPASVSWKNYGGKGIRVCARWLAGFGNFLADMGERPSKQHSLDRADGSKGYDCGACDDCKARGAGRNVSWKTQLEQCRNKTTNHVIEWNGERLSLSAWEERTGIGAATIKTRIAAGWSIDKALSTPPKRPLACDKAIIEAATAIRAMKDALAVRLGEHKAAVVIRAAARLAASCKPLPPV